MPRCSASAGWCAPSGDDLRAVTPLEEMPRIGAPATGALRPAGYTRLGQLAGVPRATLAALHGVGPKALRIIDEALAGHGLRLG